MGILLGILSGLGLSAAAGVRVSIPLLTASLAARAGHLPLAPGFGWMASDAAAIAFAALAVVEMFGYLIPFVDNLLDALAAPAAVVAGMMLTASCATPLPAALRLTLAVLLGSGTAALFQAFGATARQVPAWTAGGLANARLAAVETAGAAVLAALAVTVPAVALLAALAIGVFVVTRLLFRRPAARAA
ncbi:MAG TPA: DUF4126 domain-containing protein [Thermoanaerobaculia bacterium]